MSARPKGRATPDVPLLLATLVLIVVGVEMVYSSSFAMAQSVYKDDAYFLMRQLVWAGIGAMALMFMAAIDYHDLQRWAPLLMLVAVGAMVLVLVPGLGTSSYGSQRWLRLGPLPPVQPSEFTKLALIIYMANWLARRGTRIQKFFSGLIPFALILAAVTALIMAQPDMGTAFVVAVTAASIFFVAGANLLHFVAIIAGGVTGFVYLVFMAGYRQQRLQAFLNPWADPQDTGWHTIQTLIALGSGGITGLGLGASRQKFDYLPNAHTDAIFAIIGEELGFLGACLVISLFAILAWRGFVIASRADRFGRLLAAGITCVIVIQALTSIAVATNTVPYTGITLPFISFGGNSLVVSMAGVGLLLGISRHQPVPMSKKEEEVVAKVPRRSPARRVAATELKLVPQRGRGRRV